MRRDNHFLAQRLLGHREIKFDGRFELLKGVDPGKDQSYFLHRLTQAQQENGASAETIYGGGGSDTLDFRSGGGLRVSLADDSGTGWKIRLCYNNFSLRRQPAWRRFHVAVAWLH